MSANDNSPRALPTNGIGRRVEWLNRAVSMADDPEIAAAATRVRLERKVRRALRASGQPTRPKRLRFAGYDRTEVQIGKFRDRGAQ